MWRAVTSASGVLISVRTGHECLYSQEKHLITATSRPDQRISVFGGLGYWLAEAERIITGVFVPVLLCQVQMVSSDCSGDPVTVARSYCIKGVRGSTVL